MKSNKKPIVIISIVVSLAVVGIIFAYLFLMTDIFKSNKELFAKYFAQNEQALKKITELKTVEVFGNLENENKYESSANIKMIHSEGGEISNPLNNLSMKLDVQKNGEEQYLYADGQILYENEECLEAEIIKEQEIYGIRFTDAVNQFVTMRNDEKIETVLNNIGIDITNSQSLMNILDGNMEVIDLQEINTLKDKYLNIITKAVSNGAFKKQKNAMITYNDVTTETNAYSVELSSQQIEDLLIEILNNVKNDTELLENFEISIEKEEFSSGIDDMVNWIRGELELPIVKLTVYEKNKQTIRTVVEIGVYKVVIENIEQNNEVKIKISYIDNNTAMEINTEIIKKTLETQEDFDITISVTNDEEIYTIIISSEMQQVDNEINLNAEISHEQNITTQSVLLENKVTVGNDFEKIQTLGSENNITLNDLEETKMKNIINILMQVVPQTINDRIELLKQKFGFENVQTEDFGTENEITQVEINKFNSKFEFYTGDEVSYENVELLLEIVKNYLGSYEIEEIIPENEEDSEEDKKINIKLNIEKDKLNEQGINEIIKKIKEKDNEKYKVLIFYKENNGLIDYITITEI